MKKSVYASVVGAGIDVHYKFSTVAFVDAAGKVVRRERLEHSDREALRGWISHWPSGMTVVMEASFGWGWLSDLMEEVGLKVRLANCFKVEKMRQARGVAKTNDKDAALLAPLPKEAPTWWEVWRAPQEVRNRRGWMSHRTDLFGGGGRKFLAAVCEGKDPQGERLSSGALEALRSEMVLLLHLRQELARIAAQLRKELDRTPEVRRIMSVPGFGLILAHVLLAEMGDIKRFRRSRSLANYSLLGPKSDDTGEDPPPGQAPLGRHLGQRGNRVLKWAFIEAAHGAVRHGGQCREKFNRATNNGRRDRGRGYIKVGRSLVDVVYAVLRDQRMYQERRPNQPPQSVMNQSDKAKSRVTRPGMGRLYHPMVAAGK